MTTSRRKRRQGTAETTSPSYDDVKAAIARSGGILAEIARSLNVSRGTVTRILKKWPDLVDLIEEEVQTIGDQAERNIFDAIINGDLETSKWYARVKLRDRGYVPGSEVGVHQSGPLRITTEIVMERPEETLSDEEA